MSTTAEDKASAPVASSGGPSAGPSAISKEVLKEALKEVLVENPSLLATARRQPDDGAGEGKENSFFFFVLTSCLCVLARRPLRGLSEAWLGHS